MAGIPQLWPFQGKPGFTFQLNGLARPPSGDSPAWALWFSLVYRGLPTELFPPLDSGIVSASETLDSAYWCSVNRFICITFAPLIIVSHLVRGPLFWYCHVSDYDDY